MTARPVSPGSQLSLPLSPSPGLRLQVLGSSSAGNATLVWSDRTAILIDCGFSPRYVAKQLKALGLSLSSLSGLVVTHVHSDHVNNVIVDELTRRGVPVFCPPRIERPLKMQYASLEGASRAGLLRMFRKGGLVIGGLGLEAFEVPHDSPGGCFGYSIFDGDLKITIATDIGYPSDGMLERFADSHLIVLESNHDLEMLERSDRPAWLKRRIRERGHLSNDQCAGFAVDVLRRSETVARTIVLAHISQECNTNVLAVGCTAAALAANGFGRIPVLETHMDSPGAVVEVIP